MPFSLFNTISKIIKGQVTQKTLTECQTNCIMGREIKIDKTTVANGCYNSSTNSTIYSESTATGCLSMLGIFWRILVHRAVHHVFGYRLAPNKIDESTKFNPIQNILWYFNVSTVGLGHYTELPGITTATASSEATVTALHIVHIVSRPVSLVSVIPRQLVSESVKSQHSAKTAGSENTEKEKSKKPSCLKYIYIWLTVYDILYLKDNTKQHNVFNNKKIIQCMMYYTVNNLIHYNTI